MSGNIRLPNITGKTVEEQALQMKSYLTQLAGELNWALDNLNGAEGAIGGYTPYRSVNTGAGGSDVQKKTEELLQNFNDLKGLIIKSADIVNAYYEEINTRLSGLYVAQSEYGTFVQETNALITQSSTGITQNYENIQLVTGRVTKAEEDIVSTKEDLTGIISSTEASLQEAISNTETALQGTISQVDSDLRDVIDAQGKELRETIGQVDADLEGVISATEKRLAKTVTDTKSDLQKTIDQTKQDMIDDIDNAESNMLQNIGGVEENLNKNISDTKDLLDRSISDTSNNLGQNIDNTKSNLETGIGKAKDNLTDSIQDVNKTLDEKIGDTRADLEQKVTDAEKRLEGLIGDVNSYLLEVYANIKSGLLTEEGATPVYGIEVGQRTLVNGQEVYNKYARFTSDRLSFYDRNNIEVAYISDRKLFITDAEITGSFTHGSFVDTVMADKSIVTKWIGGG